MKKPRFKIDIKTLDKNKRLYNADADVYLEHEGEIHTFGKTLFQYSHHLVGTYFLDLKNEKVFEIISTFQEV